MAGISCQGSHVSLDETRVSTISSAPPMTNDYIVKPVYKALQVLQCLGDEQRELALSEICYRVGLPKTTVFRYLYTLRECGFVDYDPATDLYRLGLRMWELGRAAGARLRIREVAVPFMRELRNRFNETVNLGMLDDTEVVYLEIVESRRSLRMHAKLGGRDPVYSTTLGKASMAFLPKSSGVTICQRNWCHAHPKRFRPSIRSSRNWFRPITVVSLRTMVKTKRARVASAHQFLICSGEWWPPSACPPRRVACMARLSKKLLRPSCRQRPRSRCVWVIAPMGRAERHRIRSKTIAAPE
jgi:DNA-binding IclR family transcriptional regulator